MFHIRKSEKVFQINLYDKSEFVLSTDEFCDGYPHNMLPTPGYWVECSRAISNQGSAWTNDERDLHEIDEGITDSPDESLRDNSLTTDVGSSESSMPR